MALGILQQPGSNALQTADAVKATMEQLKKSFPPGLDYKIIYNPTEYVRASIAEVEKTLFEALILVVLVVMVFLQSWRAALIPIIAIPVSLVGTFAVMAAFGLLAQQPVAVRPGAGDRHRRRRRHRRGRERRAAPARRA